MRWVAQAPVSRVSSSHSLVYRRMVGCGQPFPRQHFLLFFRVHFSQTNFFHFSEEEHARRRCQTPRDVDLSALPHVPTTFTTSPGGWFARSARAPASARLQRCYS
jgi:hypothetical protein